LLSISLPKTKNEKKSKKGRLINWTTTPKKAAQEQSKSYLPLSVQSATAIGLAQWSNDKRAKKFA
jgi:hypothetical protein